jgi:hypothetical protein
MNVVPGFERFMLELLASPFASSAVGINNALAKLSIEADGNPDAERMEKALEIISNKSTPVAERLEEMSKVTSGGYITVRVEGWTGWR